MKSKNCIAVALLVALLSSCMGRMAGGGGTGVLLAKARGAPGRLDGLTQHADEPADHKGQRRIFDDGGLFCLLLHILLVFLV